jgi:hypothetical protein
VHENESTYIPIGTKHRLANPGDPCISSRFRSVLIWAKTTSSAKMRTVEDRPMRIVVPAADSSAPPRAPPCARQAEVCTIDKLTYSGSLANLTDVAESPRHRFSRSTSVMHRYARRFPSRPTRSCTSPQTHVDRSIDGPSAFVQTNVVGTYQLPKSRANTQSRVTRTPDSCTSLPMRSMEAWAQRVSFPRRARIVRIRHTKRRRQVPIISHGRGSRRTDYRYSSRIVRTITGRFSFRRS